MKSPLILAIDQGTSATKCLLVNERGEVVARGSAPLGEQHPKPGWVEQDGLEIVRSVQGAVRACLEGQDPRAVLAVGLSNQRESLVVWDERTGEPLAPVMSWQDQRTVGMCDELRSPDNEQLIRSRSGLPLDPMFSAAKARWLLDLLDARRTRSRAGEVRLGTIDSWLLSRFGGEHLIEVGNASRTQLLDVRRMDWDDDLLRLFGVPRQALPRVVSSAGPFPGLKGLDPLPSGVPVMGVLGDSHAALFAHGAFTPGQVKVTYGTGSSVMGLVERPDDLANGLCLTIAWAREGLRPAHAAEGNIRAAGATLRWMASLLEISTDALADLAAGASSDGVTVVPGFNGLGAPHWDRAAVGLVTGCTFATGRATLARAALESIPHQVCDVIEAIDRSAGRVERVHADGGPTRNPVLMQLQADLLGRPVLPSTTSELSALGAAHLAGLSTGLWSQDVLNGISRERRVVEPRMQPAERERARETWRHAVDRARSRTKQ
ncbi:FGGY-family carbohydrate kinase [Sorangium sp. So ce1389]|uniref:FGGY-family carbohydrate kinase n=1 Tax=Sorangium sp. So ce1389 TaxID=3133336 RepID=UPI003F645F6F